MNGPGALPELGGSASLRVAAHLSEDPVAVTFERFAGVGIPLELHLGDVSGPGWRRATALIEGGRALEDALMERRGVYVGADARFAGVALVLDTLVVAASPLVAVFTDRRAVDLSARRVAVRLGAEPAVAVTDPLLAVLPDDPAASDPTATVVGDLDELLDWVVASFFSGFVSPFIGEVNAATRASRRVLWAMATSAVASAASAATGVTGDACSVRNEIDALFRRVGGAAAAMAPQLGGVARRELTQVRRTCCLFHTLPDASNCTTCPFRSEESRRALARRAIGARTGTATPGSPLACVNSAPAQPRGPDTSAR